MQHFHAQLFNTFVPSIFTYLATRGLPSLNNTSHFEVLRSGIYRPFSHYVISKQSGCVCCETLATQYTKL